MKKKKKKVITIIAIVVAVVILVTGGILAYLTDTDQKTNVFTVGSIKIELTETNWNPSNGQNILPGQPINKNPKINNIGNNTAYVYIKVVNPIVTLNNGEGPLFSYTTNSGWTQLDQIEQCGYRATTYYYNNSLNPSNSTNALFDNVTINDFSDEIGEEQLLDIYAYGIQSTYLESGSTIQSIFNDAFTAGLSDTDEKCPVIVDCNDEEFETTKPSSLTGLAKIMAKQAYLDNGKSEFVNSCSGVKFNAISSDTNGKGIYEIASTKNDMYPIYYYRGAVDNNNVKFAGFCWKAIRTTNTGGVKMIYNGSPDGSGNCSNTTGTSTQIGTIRFNANSSSPADVGYMYGRRYAATTKLGTDIKTPYIYGGDVTYSEGIYTLTNTMTSTGDWSYDYNKVYNNHYTCFSNSTTCTNVYYLFNTSRSIAMYITLTNGKTVSDALEEMFLNTTNSTIKNTIENWFASRLLSYTNYIEDTIYCNDRSISNLGGWNPNGGKTDGTNHWLRFNTNNNATPSLICSRELDRFTVSNINGNGKLKYPIGLITSDEIMYAGGKTDAANTAYYLYTNQSYWAMSTLTFIDVGASEAMVLNNGYKSGGYVTHSEGYRPVISLSPNAVISSGDGTQNNPYTVQTN